MIAKGIDLTNLDTGEKDISKIRDRIIAANVYIGADSIIDALKAVSYTHLDVYKRQV